jgi:hypothetical protein
MQDAPTGTRSTPTSRSQRLFSIRPGRYILVIVGAMCLAFLYTLHRDGIFACQAHEYTPDCYLAECSAPGYGDYEHGAFWFDLEPTAIKDAGRAQVIFMGDSRVQIAFSTTTTANWFSLHSLSYYLLGFGYSENVTFLQDLLRKLEPQAKVYVINADSFFDRKESIPGKYVKQDPDAVQRYKVKRIWQFFHRVCSLAPALCGDKHVVFRSRAAGTYFESGGERPTDVPVVFNPNADQDVVKRDTASALDFIPRLQVRRECILLTSIPHARTAVDLEGTNIETSKALAAALGLAFVSPQLEGLATIDTSHLDRPSAERWSKAFFEMAGPQIAKCINGP